MSLAIGVEGFLGLGNHGLRLHKIGHRRRARRRGRAGLLRRRAPDARDRRRPHRDGNGKLAVQRACRKLPARAGTLRREIRGTAAHRGLCHSQSASRPRVRHQCRLHQGRSRRQPAGSACDGAAEGPVCPIRETRFRRARLLRTDMGLYAQRSPDREPARPQGQEDTDWHAGERNATHSKPAPEGQRHQPG